MSQIVYSHELKNLTAFPEAKNLVLVTSTIHYGDRPLSYSPVRSVYPPRERFEQLGKTIRSVKEKIKDCCVVILETSELSEEEKHRLGESVDLVVLFGDDKKAKKLSCGPLKGAAEVCLLKYFLEGIRCSFGTLHKISGRYFLNDNYDPLKLHPEKYNFTGARGILNTRYYTVPFKERRDFLLRLGVIGFLARFGRSIEWWFNLFLPKGKIHMVIPIGISGNSAADGVYIEE